MMHGAGLHVVPCGGAEAGLLVVLPCGDTGGGREGGGLQAVLSRGEAGDGAKAV